MKRIFTLTAGLMMIVSALAQTLEIKQNHIYINGDPASAELVGHGIVTMKNGAGDLIWKRIDTHSAPANWENAICDNNTCHAVDVSSASVTLKDGEESIMDLHVYPYSTAGNADIDVAVWVGTDTANADTIHYHVDTWPLSKKTLAKNPKELSLYPNPAKTNVNLSFKTKDAINVEIYNVLGSVVQTAVHTGEVSNINIESLPSGLYIVRVADAGTTYSKTFKKID